MKSDKKDRKMVGRMGFKGLSHMLHPDFRLVLTGGIYIRMKQLQRKPHRKSTPPPNPG